MRAAANKSISAHRAVNKILLMTAIWPNAIVFIALSLSLFRGRGCAIKPSVREEFAACARTRAKGLFLVAIIFVTQNFTMRRRERERESASRGHALVIYALRRRCLVNNRLIYMFSREESSLSLPRGSLSLSPAGCSFLRASTGVRCEVRL